MANTHVRDVDDDLLKDYRADARRHGQSLNAALKAGLERGRPSKSRSRADRLALSLALTSDSRPTSDSTAYIRWLRDTDGGRYFGNDADDDRR